MGQDDVRNAPCGSRRSEGADRGRSHRRLHPTRSHRAATHGRWRPMTHDYHTPQPATQGREGHERHGRHGSHKSGTEAHRAGGEARKHTTMRHSACRILFFKVRVRVCRPRRPRRGQRTRSKWARQAGACSTTGGKFGLRNVLQKFTKDNSGSFHKRGRSL